jgi:hypothetical protein
MVHHGLVDSIGPDRFGSVSDWTSRGTFKRQHNCGRPHRLGLVAIAELLQFADGIDQLDIQLVSATSNCCDSAHHRDARCDCIQSPSVIDDHLKIARGAIRA